MRGKGLYVILTDSGPHLGATHNFGYANEIQLLNEELLDCFVSQKRLLLWLYVEIPGLLVLKCLIFCVLLTLEKLILTVQSEETSHGSD